MKHKKKSQSSNLRLAIFFCVGVLFLVAVSFLIKVFLIVKASNYDGNHRYNLAIYQENRQSIISFSPQSKSISILTLRGSVNGNIGKFTELPIDASVKDNGGTVIDKDTISSSISHYISGYTGLRTDMTIIDAIRIFLFAKEVPKTSIYERDLSSKDSLSINSFTSSFFIDPQIANEKVTIEIINGTQVFGLGNRLANLLNNIGADVVLVTSSEKEEQTTKVTYFGDSNYTIKRISKILGVKPTNASQRDISDVTITIGNDIISKINF